VTPTDVAIARRVCTAAELQVVELTEQGMSQRQVAALLDLSRGAVRDRLERAMRKIRKAAA